MTEVTREEIVGEIDRLADERFGIGAEEFFPRWYDGALNDFDPKVARVAMLARLLLA